MRFSIPDMKVGLTLFFIWLAVVCAIAAGVLITRWWRRRHPLPAKPATQSYSQKLRRRIAASGASQGHSKKSGSASKLP